MATSWQEIVDLGARGPSAVATAEEEAPEQRRGVFRRLKESLSKSRQALTEEISASLFDRIDDETWELLEEALILADVGAPTTAAVVERLEHEVESGAVPMDGVAVRDRLIEILAEVAIDRPGADRPLGRAGDPDDGRGQRHRQDDDDRQDRLAPEQGDGPQRGDGRRRHLPRRRRRAAGNLGRARRRRANPRRRGLRPRRRRLRRDQRRPRPRRRRRHRRHRRPPPHPDQPDGGAGEGAPGDPEADPRGAARDADLDRRHHRPERPAPGEDLLRGGRRRRRRPDQARRHRHAAASPWRSPPTSASR